MISKTFRQIATGVAAASLSVPVITAVASADTTSTTAASVATETPGDVMRDKSHRGNELRSLLDDAVAADVITAEQADAIVELADTTRAHPQRGGEGHRSERDGRRDAGRRGDRGDRIEVGRGRHRIVDALSAVTGRTADDIRADLKGGASPAEVAGDDLDALVARLTADAEEHLAAGVAGGHLTAQQADEMLAALVRDLPERLAETRTGPAGPRDGGSDTRPAGEQHGEPDAATGDDAATND